MMKGQGFPGGMAYPFGNPDATYSSPNGPKQILEQIIDPPSISFPDKVVMKHASDQQMGDTAEAEAQELTQSDPPAQISSTGFVFQGRWYPRGRPRGRGRGQGRGQGIGRGNRRGRSCRVGCPRARRGLSDITRIVAMAAISQES